MIIFEPGDIGEKQRCVRAARLMVWIYFWLLFGEGILRKWLLPDYSAPLAVVRDPVLIVALVLTMRAHLFPLNILTVSLGFVAFCSLAVGLLPEDNTLLVDINGFRTDFLHFTLLAIMPVIMTREDVNRMVKFSIWLLPWIALLMVIQFYSPKDSWINRSTGISIESIQVGADVDHIRPPSIFTFISGVAEYVTMVSAFLLAAMIGRISLSPLALLAGGAGLFVAIAVSISRMALLGVVLVVLTFLIFTLFRPNMASQLIVLVVIGMVMALVLLQLGFLDKSLNTFSTRVELASDNEGGVSGGVARILNVVTDPIRAWPGVPWFGLGLGTLTNAAIMLTVGNLSHIQVENETTRLLWEGGLIMGPMFIFWRFMLGAYLLLQSLRVAFQHGEPLALFLIPIAAQLVMIGQLGRPTTLGFTAFTAGLCLTIIHQSDTNNPKVENEIIFPKGYQPMRRL